MARRPNWRALKIHRNYTVDEAARTLGVCKATVRRWIKAHGLPTIDDRKPVLIHGPALIAFGKSRQKSRQVCQVDQAYCFSCKCPRHAAFGQIRIAEASVTSANVRMLCHACSTRMHKRIAWRDLTQLSLLTQLSAPEALRHLIETAQPCLIVHYEKDE